MRELSKRFETLNFLIATTILLVVPLYPKFPLINVPGTHVSIRLEDFLLFFVALYVVFRIIKLKKPFRGSVEKAIFLFLAVGLASVFSGYLITKTVSPLIGVFHWVRRIEYLIPLFFVSLTAKYWKNRLGLVVSLIAIVIFCVFLFGVGQKYFYFPVVVTQSSEAAKGIAFRYVSGNHLSSTFAGHYDMASYLVMTLPVIVLFFVFVKKRKQKIALGGVFLMGLWLLSNSLSRISVVSYLIAVVVSLFVAKKYKEIPVIVLISLLIFGMSSNLLDRYMRIFQVARNEISTVEVTKTAYAQNKLPERQKTVKVTPSPIPVFEDRSTSIRLDVEWPRALRALKKNPLLGTGYSSITLATDNDWLRLLGEVGILGFSSFLLIFAWIFQKARKAFSNIKKMGKEDGIFFYGFTGSLIGVFVNALFIDIFEASKFAIIFWFMVGLYLVVLRKYENNEEKI